METQVLQQSIEEQLKQLEDKLRDDKVNAEVFRGRERR